VQQRHEDAGVVRAVIGALIKGRVGGVGREWCREVEEGGGQQLGGHPLRDARLTEHAERGERDAGISHHIEAVGPVGKGAGVGPLRAAARRACSVRCADGDERIGEERAGESVSLRRRERVCKPVEAECERMRQLGDHQRVDLKRPVWP
jgi:hypothetical protein